MPSVNALSAALLACAGSAVATQFTLTDTYDHTNFFDKFTFNDAPDSNSGFVVYQNQANAVSQGLAKITDNNEVYLGVDHSTVLKGAGFPGRNSLRLESKASYKHGLIVARFTHLPANRCGSWPSFWTLGDSWPNDGEIDVYEGWNNIVNNQPAFHVGDTKTFGQCILESAGQTAPVATGNCDNSFQSPPTQFLNQGCTATDGNGPWASSNGGTYAIEWTSDYIKLYNWARGAEPANLASSSPDTSTWGTPAVNLQNSNCNIDSHFNSQRMILDIDFCGNPVGTPAFWEQGCSAATKQATCTDYVAKFPGDFAESFFQIQDIRYFTEGASQSATTSQSASSSVAASTSVAASHTVEASSPVAASSAASSAVVVPTSVIISQPGSPIYPVPANSTSAFSVLPTGGAGYPVPSSSGSSGPETITTDITIVHTITSCAPEVTNCPARHSTQVIHTTLPAPQPTGSASPVVTPGAPAPSSAVLLVLLVRPAPHTASPRARLLRTAPAALAALRPSPLPSPLFTPLPAALLR
ncbi:concanavalin A-like lectin/glucanase domain-containing protein [Trichoderma longibrachiatum]